VKEGSKGIEMIVIMSYFIVLSK